ncbi:MAG: hypothetical protein WC756_20860 [Taibaiella sp.]
MILSVQYLMRAPMIPDGVHVVHGRFQQVPDFARTVLDWVRLVKSGR